MVQTALKTATYEDLLKVPDNLVAEIIDGELVTHPRPAPRHALASSVLGNKIGSPFHGKGDDGPGGWWILDEPELHLGEEILVPDLAGWKREKMPHLPESAFFETPPDWICEVLSPRTIARDRTQKRAIYARFGISWLWFINPDERSLEAFELKNGRWMLIAAHVNNDKISVAPFGAISFPLSDLWAD